MISLQSATIQAVLFHERIGAAASKALERFYCEVCNDLEKRLNKSWSNYSRSNRRVGRPRQKRLASILEQQHGHEAASLVFCINFLALLYVLYSTKPFKLRSGYMNVRSIVNCCCSVVTSV
uniref:Uncharacterized protein n=1 Tax=Hyaloperonospora arabidopsidis (strain Emoy2) TaxID=559515 RepID=M4BNS6_HYAAE